MNFVYQGAMRYHITVLETPIREHERKLRLACVQLSNLEGSGKMHCSSLIWLSVVEQIISVKSQTKVTGFGFQAFLYLGSKNRWGKSVDHLQHFPLFLGLLESSPNWYLWS